MQALMRAITIMKANSKRVIRAAITFFIATASFGAATSAQTPPSVKNAALLYPVFEKLSRLESGKGGKVNIVHIGDSHIQGDHLTDAARQPLQQRFGDGGRGFIFPYTRNKASSQPYRFYTNADWRVCRNSQPSKCEPGTEFGLSGYGFATKTQPFALSVEASETRYHFNTIKVISPSVTSYRLATIDGNKKPLSYADTSAFRPVEFRRQEPFLVSYRQEKPMSSIYVLSAKKQDIYNINGLVVEKDAPGVVYHNIGTIGSMADHFNATPLFFEQLPILRPDLVVVSFGTNESFGELSADEFMGSMELILDNVKMYCRGVPVLVTTPPASLLRNKRPNSYVAEYSEAMLRKTDVAVWDLYKFTGGLAVAEETSQPHKISGDNIHYTVEGYVDQGTALAAALLEEYNRYVRRGK